MSTDYEFNEEMAGRGDDVAMRIDTSAAYVGKFTEAWATTSQKGGDAIELHFETALKEKTQFTLYTRQADGTPIFGQNQLQAIMALMGLRGLKGVPGKVQQYNNDTNKREEVDGVVYPDLCERSIGLMLQKELYDGNKGPAWRMNLYATYDPVTRRTSTEIKERVVKGTKVDKMLASLKDKNSRKNQTTVTPVVGAVAAPPDGSY